MPASVSIIIPCYNEERTIRNLLSAILGQTYPTPQMEVVIADGISTDRTREEIDHFKRENPDLQVIVVDNPKRIIPTGLNMAIGHAHGEIILRLDGHCMPYPDYVERCVEALELGLGANVGGVWEIHPGADTWVGRGIAMAAAHRLGVGDAHYRHAVRPAAVDTVPFGAFKRNLLALVGFFDESLLSNEDYEFNARIRGRGDIVWLDPGIRSVYFARSTLGALARQYWRYGYWKYRMLRRYPNTLRWRQFLPPLFVFSLVSLGLAGLFWPACFLLLAAELTLYLAILTAAGVLAAIKSSDASLAVSLPLAIATMHLCWGSGFLWSIIEGKSSTVKTGKD